MSRNSRVTPPESGFIAFAKPIGYLDEDLSFLASYPEPVVRGFFAGTQPKSLRRLILEGISKRAHTLKALRAPLLERFMDERITSAFAKAHWDLSPSRSSIHSPLLSASNQKNVFYTRGKADPLLQRAKTVNALIEASVTNTPTLIAYPSVALNRDDEPVSIQRIHCGVVSKLVFSKAGGHLTSFSVKSIALSGRPFERRFSLEKVQGVQSLEESRTPVRMVYTSLTLPAGQVDRVHWEELEQEDAYSINPPPGGLSSKVFRDLEVAHGSESIDHY